MGSIPLFGGIVDNLSSNLSQQQFGSSSAGLGAKAPMPPAPAPGLGAKAAEAMPAQDTSGGDLGAAMRFAADYYSANPEPMPATPDSVKQWTDDQRSYADTPSTRSGLGAAAAAATPPQEAHYGGTGLGAAAASAQPSFVPNTYK